MPYSFDQGGNVFLFLYSQIGALGVMVFFVISGFLITCSVAGGLEADPYKKFDFQRYIFSRLKRLFPPLFFCQLLLLFCFGVLYFFDAVNADFFATGREKYLVRENLEFNIFDYAGTFAFLNTIVVGVNSPVINGPLWSVAQEFWFYLVFGLMVSSFYNRWTLVALVLVLTFLAFQENVFLLYGFGVWLFGCLVGVLHIKKLNHHGAVVVFFLVSFFIWVLLLCFNESSFVRARHKFVFGIAFSFLMLLLVANDWFKARLARLWVAKKIAYQARYSYTLYLVHFPLMILVWVFTNRYVQGDIVLSSLLALASIVLIFFFSGMLSMLIEPSARDKAQRRHLSFDDFR